MHLAVVHAVYIITRRAVPNRCFRVITLSLLQHNLARIIDLSAIKILIPESPYCDSFPWSVSLIYCRLSGFQSSLILISLQLAISYFSEIALLARLLCMCYPFFNTRFLSSIAKKKLSSFVLTNCHVGIQPYSTSFVLSIMRVIINKSGVSILITCSMLVTLLIVCHTHVIPP